MTAPPEASIEELRARRGTKWASCAPDVLPAWVADMDFGVAPAVQAAVERLAAERDYGYPLREGEEPAERAVARAFSRHYDRLYGWAPDPELAVPLPDLVQALTAAVVAFTDRGEGVQLQVPAYPPFLSAITACGRRVLANRMVDDGAGWQLDLDGLAAGSGRAGLMLICSPHNPTGRVFTPDELRGLGRVALERDLVIVCDEVHAELVYPGHRQVPLAVACPEVAAQTITISSATKSHNIAGLRCAVMHFGSRALLQRFRRRIPEGLTGHVGVAGIDATIAAWEEGGEWLREVMLRLRRNRRQLRQSLSRRRGIRYHDPDATYLAWIDMSDLGLQPTPWQFLLEEAHVLTSAGADFGSGYEGFVRLNFATGTGILTEILARIGDALDRHG